MKKLFESIRIYFAVNGLESLKKRAIKQGYCKPEGNDIDYPKKGARVV